MGWILLFVVAGGSYMAVNSYVFPMLLLAFALGVVVFYILTAVQWVDNHSGVSTFMVKSFQTLSGVDTPGQVVQDNQCHFGTGALNFDLFGFLATMVLSLVVIGLAVVNAVPGIVAMVTLPVALAVLLVGCISTIISVGEEKKILAGGLALLTFGCGAVIVAGLMMRMIHALSGVCF